MKIHCSIYDPAGSVFKQLKKDKAECVTIECSCDNCELRDKEHCAMIQIFNAPRCPYGKHERDVGFTKRARGYHNWLNKRREENVDVPRLTSPPSKIARVGEYIYLPYAHMNLDNDDFLQKGHALSSGSPFIRAEDWDIELVKRLIDKRPQALFGGEITSYQKEVVPKFITHLKEFDPEMFAQLPGCYKEKVLPIVGRRAYLHSLIPPCEISPKNKKYPVTWTWDGEYLVSYDNSAYNSTWGDIKAEKVCIRIKPKKNEWVIVEDELWVSEDTEFVN